MNYEMIVGLETHLELATQSKIFCGCSTAFGAPPNTQCCPVCLGLPGSLPRLNRRAVELAAMAGLALGCRVATESRMDRKNYTYPDLVKAYQISQYDRPLCEGGSVTLESGRQIGITRIHIEEDAGKLMRRDDRLLIDYNRAGVPLIEVVTEPDFRSAAEVREYLELLQLTMKTLGVSDCRMQEGSLRCDVNISVRPAGSDRLGTRTEIKNVNSFAFITRALEWEFRRQVALLEAGKPVQQETLRFNAETGQTERMRSKEDVRDYRFFREPDLGAVMLQQAEIDALRDAMPELPQARTARLCESYGLPREDAALLVRCPRAADLLEATAARGGDARQAAKFLLGPIFRRLPTEAEKEAFALPLSAEHFAELLLLLQQRQITLPVARAVLERMLDTGLAPAALLTPEERGGVAEDALADCCRTAIEQNPRAAADFCSGKEKALQALVGAVMRATRGRADAAAAEAQLRALLHPDR